MIRRSLATWVAAWCAAVGLAVMVGCGGGVGSGGTGISEDLVQGTVNGFGSVIVDGDRFDDSQVPTLAETEPGVWTQTEALMGERVEVEHEASGVARRLHVIAALVGQVDAVNAPDSFSVLGQTVTVNADAARGPVTQFGGGHTGIGSVLSGDAVEVHGFIVRGAAGFSIQATRVQRLAVLPSYLKLVGLASEVDVSGFKLGALVVDTSAATILPAGRSISDGQTVAVMAPADSLLAAPGAATQLSAAQVRLPSLGEAGARVNLSGAVSGLDTQAFAFDLDGARVSYVGATLLPPGTRLADASYVQVRGTVQPDGSVRASSVELRDGAAEAEAELKGNVDGLDAAGRRFSVRGVVVDASGAAIEGCPGEALADGLYVSVEGALTATSVLAKSVHCEDEPDDATVERDGVAEAVDAAALRLLLRMESGAVLDVRWTTATYFQNLTVDTLAGQRLEVEGRLVDGVLVAQRIGVEDDD